MIAHRVRRDHPEGDAPRAGWVLCSDVRGADGRVALRKGAVLRPGDLAALPALAWEELHLIEPEPGELHEEEAGRRLAAAVAGDGVEVGGYGGSAWPLAAAWRGVLEVDAGALRASNSLDGVSAYTLYHGQVVDAGEVVARVKAIPLVLPAEQVRGVEAIAGGAQGGVVRVRPFLPLRVGALVQDSLGDAPFERFRVSLAEKVGWLGSELLPPVRVAGNGAEVAAGVERLLGQGAQVIVVAGIRAMDPLDPAFEALRRLGVRLERLGVPAHPGSLLWLARLGEVPLVGMPGCGLFSQATVFDLVFPRILAGERVGKAELAELGHGGFLTRDMAFRFPPYRPARVRGEVP